MMKVALFILALFILQLITIFSGLLMIHYATTGRFDINRCYFRIAQNKSVCLLLGCAWAQTRYNPLISPDVQVSSALRYTGPFSCISKK